MNPVNPTRRRFSIIATALGAVPLLTLASGAAHAQTGAKPRLVAQTAPPRPGATRPTLEMVFVLDTTGSMGGLLDGAKARIWGIVNEVMATPSRPRVKIGLVAYRDHGDQYVTQVSPLTADLDKVYSTLMDYQANGGGDEPEDVRKALADGVARAGWSPKGQNLAQILFLVGDAPPHNDYQDEPDLLTTTGSALRRGLTINTILCGDSVPTRETWQAVARAGGGTFFAIPQTGGVQTIATPYDEKLSQLGGKIGGTYYAYGGSGAARRAKVSGQMAFESRVSAAAPAIAQADRAANKAINVSAGFAKDDLVQGVENGTVSLDKVKVAELPDDLQKLSPQARKAEITRRVNERKQIRAQILAVSKKRDAFVVAARKKQAAKNGGKNPAGSFDTAVAAAIKKQAGRKGIKL